MKIIKIAQTVIAYHGTPHQFDQFDLNLTGKGNEQEGPGIYFTTNKQQALGYGSRIIKAQLHLNNVVQLSGTINEDHIRTLILQSLGLSDESELESMDGSDEFWDSNLSNYGESLYGAYESAVNAVLRYSTSPHDAFQTVWYEHYRDNAGDYLRNMIKLGYDGVVIPAQDATHYVVFNPNAIEVFK